MHPNTMPPRTWCTRRAHEMAVLVGLLVPLACGPAIPFPRESEQVQGGTGGAPDASPPSSPAGSWTLVALPDTQNAVSSYPEILYQQTAWIAANAERLNVKYVVGEGDITNDSAKDQWNIADHAFRLLDERVPYAMVMGNHDYPGGGTMESRDTDRFDEYFPPSRIATQKGFHSSFDPESVANAAYRFTANGQEWLIFALEFGPRDVVLAWVESVLAANPTAQAILATHAYLFDDGTRLDRVNGKDQYNNPHDYEGEEGRLGGVNDAQEMWDKLIAKTPSIRFVLCGHMHDQARQESKRPDGTNVHEILADYQSDDMGGGGYMRLMTFAPDGKVYVRSYSPYFDRYLTDRDNEFVLSLDPPPASAPAQP